MTLSTIWLTPSKLEGIFRAQNISVEAERLSIYLAGSLTIESEARLFGIEETDGRIHFQQDGVDYIYLLEIDLATGLTEADPNPKGNKASNFPTREKRRQKSALRGQAAISFTQKRASQ